MIATNDPIAQALATHEVILADGAMGTNLFAMGLAHGDPGESWNVERPDDVRAVHQGFVEAGSDILLTNTFSANRLRLSPRGMQARTRELNLAGAALARNVADQAARRVIVAGSIGPTGDIFEPLGPRTVAQAEAAFHEQAEALREGGVDVAWIESMYDENELRAAVRGVELAGLPFVTTMTFDTRGHTMMGIGPADALRLFASLPRKPLAYGANCGVGPAQLLDSVLGLAEGAQPGDILVAKSNCGLPIMLDDTRRVRYDGTPGIMAAYARLARDAGARIIGGCCGTTAAHVRAMAEALAQGSRGPAPTFDRIERELGPVPARTAQHPRGASRQRG